MQQQGKSGGLGFRSTSSRSSSSLARVLIGFLNAGRRVHNHMVIKEGGQGRVPVISALQVVVA